MIKTSLSPKELARCLGVSESSVKRWVDDGIIQATKTAGGHRRISVAEAIRHIRATGSEVVEPSLLGLADVSRVKATHPRDDFPAEQLYRFLREGHLAEAKGLIWSLYLSGRPVAEICDFLIRRAMHKIGHEWEHGPEGIFVEHRASEVCVQALTQIRLTMRVDESAPVAVGGAVPGDVYTLPSLAASTVIVSQGLRAINLGGNTPFEALKVAGEVYKPQIFWLSCSHIEDDSLSGQIQRFVEEVTQQGAFVAVGGEAAGQLVLDDHARLLRASSLSELAAFLKGINTPH